MTHFQDTAFIMVSDDYAWCQSEISKLKQFNVYLANDFYDFVQVENKVKVYKLYLKCIFIST